MSRFIYLCIWETVAVSCRAARDPCQEKMWVYVNLSDQCGNVSGEDGHKRKLNLLWGRICHRQQPWDPSTGQSPTYSEANTLAWEIVYLITLSCHALCTMCPFCELQCSTISWGCWHFQPAGFSSLLRYVIQPSEIIPGQSQQQLTIVPT